MKQFIDQRHVIGETEIRKDTDSWRYFFADETIEIEELYPSLLSNEEKKDWQKHRFEWQLVYEMRSGSFENHHSLPDYEKIRTDLSLTHLNQASRNFPASFIAVYGIAIGLFFYSIGKFACKKDELHPTQSGLGWFRHLAIWFFVTILSGIMTYFISTRRDLPESYDEKVLFDILAGLLAIVTVVGFVRSALTTDRYTRTSSHRNIFNIFWILLLGTILWQFVHFVMNQKKFLQQAYSQEPSFFLAGILLLILGSHFAIKLMSYKSKNTKPEKKGRNLILGFMTLIPISILFVLLSQLFVYMTDAGGNWVHEDWFWMPGVFNGVSISEAFEAQPKFFTLLIAWNFLYGVQIFFFFVLLFVGLSVFWRRLRLLDSKTTPEESTVKIPLWRPMFRAMRTSSLAMGVIGLVVWLAIEPKSIELTENNYHKVISEIDHPEKYWIQYAPIVDEIKADEKLMKQLREKVKKNLAERRRKIRENIESAKKKNKKGDRKKKKIEKTTSVV